MTDTLNDTIVRIKNALMRKHQKVIVINSRLIRNVLTILKNEGFILDYSINPQNIFQINVLLKYAEDKPIIKNIVKISKSGSRVYSSVTDLKNFVKTPFDICIISTSRGLLTHNDALVLNLGGEVLLRVF